MTQGDRGAADLLAAGTVAPLALSPLPHAYVRLAAVPVGVALAGLGYALWSDRRERVSDPLPGTVSRQLRQAAAAAE